MPDPKKPTRADDEQLLQVVLGSSSLPPQGSYVNPEFRDPDTLARRLAEATVRLSGWKTPNIDLAWRSAKQQYPYVAANVAGIDLNAQLPRGAAAEVTRWPDGPLPPLFNPLARDLQRVSHRPTVRVNPRLEKLPVMEITDILAHELAHVAQAQNFPDFKSLWAADRRDQQLPYRERIAEQQAHAVSDARRRLRGDVHLPLEKK